MALSGLSSKTLSNGLKVVAIEAPTSISTVGITISSGSRYETPDRIGASHFLKRLVFKAPESGRTALSLNRGFENLPSVFTSSFTREHNSFYAQFPSSKVSDFLSLLGEAIKPRAAEWEVRDIRSDVKDETAAALADPSVAVNELIHQVAYRGIGLGNSLYARDYVADHISNEKVKEHITATYDPSRAIVIGVGVDSLEKFAQKVESSIHLEKSIAPLAPISKYVGGEFLLPGLGDSHLALVFPGATLGAPSSKPLATFAVLQALLGNGSQKILPGQGAQSRLAKLVQAHSGALISARAINVNYSDSGLFGIYAQAKAGLGKNVIESIAQQLTSLAAGKVEASELSRAKAQASARVLFDLEQRENIFNYISKQSLVCKGDILTAEALKAQIESVTVADISSALKESLKSSPTLVGLGNVAGLQSQQQTAQLFA